jgi:hypothetical protein
MSLLHPLAKWLIGDLDTGHWTLCLSNLSSSGVAPATRILNYVIGRDHMSS